MHEYDVASLLLDSRTGDAVTVEELVATFLHLRFAGHEATTNLIGNGLLSPLCDEPSHPGRNCLGRPAAG